MNLAIWRIGDLKEIANSPDREIRDYAVAFWKRFARRDL
jgi:hypothetical protein